jgi:hypothetical protein
MVSMPITTPAGNAYTFRDLEAGLERITARPVPNGPHTVVTGFKENRSF